ncbi:retropepsin-like aspartic protease [Neolewinella agarilytica]|uniref:Aspartyl protease n=1 Tax=Neolewinella agarilytica TaxID=478744 RepID=A0A1H9MUT7_9BACT|nr:retropepsin-like aspartic protease [Neolewinella agarilytica]SER27239.1 Aspartyl protease [Neolewinella agarilytica]
MLSHCFYKAGFGKISVLFLLLLILIPFPARAQDAVSILRAENRGGSAAATAPLMANAQGFNFVRNLIFFPARVDGRQGNFILDTGAPSLLLNHRGETEKTSPATTGLGAGGEVELASQRVRSFEMGGLEMGSRWALSLDLRSMESRTGQRIDGYVGYDLISKGELRIDYPNRNFRLLNSERKPLEKGEAPIAVLRFSYIDHLPVVELKMGGKNLRFVVDTGAGKNLIDPQYAILGDQTNREINIQGLDGGQATLGVCQMPVPERLPVMAEQLQFVTMDLSHLQSPGHPPIAGIIGADFLAKYCVGIDYRRRKLYLW